MNKLNKQKMKISTSNPTEEEEKAAGNAGTRCLILKRFIKSSRPIFSNSLKTGGTALC
jgi:hypothetical protein